MKIFGSTMVHSPQSISGPHRAAATQPNRSTSSLSEVDQLDISAAGDLASRSMESPDRSERISQIRAAIEAGTYETDAKLNAALDRLLDQLSG